MAASVWAPTHGPASAVEQITAPRAIRMELDGQLAGGGGRPAALGRGRHSAKCPRHTSSGTSRGRRPIERPGGRPVIKPRQTLRAAPRGILPADTRRRVMPSRQTDRRVGQPGTGPATAPSAPATLEVYTARLGAGRRSIRRRRVICRGRRGVRRRRVCRRRGICRRWGICRWRVICRRRVIRRRGVIHRRRGVVDGWGCIEIRRPNKDATIPSTTAAVPASATTTATVPIRVSRGGRHQRQCQRASQGYDTKRRINNDRTHGVSLL
jgi:hypothetical protein